MTVSISNMAQVWMSNTNTYNAIAMSVSTMGYGASANSSLLKLSVDGNTRFNIDGIGRIYNPNRPIFTGQRISASPAWEAYSSNSIWVANSAILNNGNCYNTSTGLFTCPVAGFYRISAGILCGQPNTYGYMMYYKSGVYSSYLNHFNGNANSVWATITYSVVVQASVNDTLGVGVISVGGATFYNQIHNHVCIEHIG